MGHSPSGDAPTTDQPGGPPPPVGIIHPRPAPELELKDSSGRAHRLSDFKGKAVIIHFWASWCPPCIDEIPNWLELAKQSQGRPLAFIAVSLDQRWSDAQKILPDPGASSSVLSLMDPEGKIPERFGTYQYPETYLLNPRLEIVAKWVGSQNWGSQAIHDDIEYAMRGAK